MRYLSVNVFVLILLSCLTALSSFDAHCGQTVTLPGHEALLLPNFDQGLMRGGKSRKRYISHLQGKKNARKEFYQHRLELLRASYNHAVSVLKEGASVSSETLHIPRIVHQIWLGSPVPRKYQEWMTTWMNWHGWEYRLWTDEEVSKLALVNQDIYDKVSNYGQKSDILRMELLYTMGGLYVDTDFECLKADFFDVLHQYVDFYVGVEPLEHSFLRINNAIIASAPGHPLMQQMIQDLPKHFEATKDQWALISTGPVFMSKVIYAYLEQEHPGEVNMFLPCSLVYPFTSSEVDRSPSKDLLVPMKESVAVHYWSKSWVKKKR